MRRTLLGADDVVITAAPDLASLRNAKNIVDLVRQARPNDTPPQVGAEHGRPARPPRNPDQGLWRGARPGDLRGAPVRRQAVRAGGEQRPDDRRARAEVESRRGFAASGPPHQPPRPAAGAAQKSAARPVCSSASRRASCSANAQTRARPDRPARRRRRPRARRPSPRARNASSRRRQTGLAPAKPPPPGGAPRRPNGRRRPRLAKGGDRRDEAHLRVRAAARGARRRPPPRSSASRATTITPTKTTIFNALINTIDLAQLAQLDPKTAGEEIRDIVAELVAIKNVSMSVAETGTPGPGHHQRRPRLWPARAAAGARRHRRHHGQRRGPGVHRSRRQGTAHQRPLPRQRPADEHLPADRQPGRPPRRRELADLRRAPSRRQPGQRHRAAAGARRPDADHPEVQERQAHHAQPGRATARSARKARACWASSAPRAAT